MSAWRHVTAAARFEQELVCKQQVLDGDHAVDKGLLVATAGSLTCRHESGMHA